MHIVHSISSLSLHHGGTVRAVFDLTTRLVKSGHAVTLLTGDRADAPAEWDGHDGRPDVLEYVTSKRPLRPIAAQSLKSVEALMRRADVIHLHGIWQTECIALSRIAKRHGTACVFSCHGMLDDWCMAQKSLKKRIYYGMFLKQMFADAAAIHCTAKAELDQSSKWFERSKGVVIPLIFDLEEFRELPGPQLAHKEFADAFRGVPVVLFLSRIHVKKGIERLIGAADLLAQQNVECRVAIAGNGEPEYVQELKDLVTSKGLEDMICFVGFASGREKISLYQAADVFVLPTSQENWGFVILEAMAAGTPVITTRGVDIWPELEASGAATIVDMDAVAIAGAIAASLKDRETLAKQSRTARNWVLESLDEQAVIQQYIGLYEGCSR